MKKIIFNILKILGRYSKTVIPVDSFIFEKTVHEKEILMSHYLKVNVIETVSIFRMDIYLTYDEIIVDVRQGIKTGMVFKTDHILISNLSKSKKTLNFKIIPIDKSVGFDNI